MVVFIILFKYKCDWLTSYNSRSIRLYLVCIVDIIIYEIGSKFIDRYMHNDWAASL